jgi:hypothetical protein
MAAVIGLSGAKAAIWDRLWRWFEVSCYRRAGRGCMQTTWICEDMANGDSINEMRINEWKKTMEY